ncbi:MAG TPA: hypothetical protein V6C89_14990 [Drouetiella sp.]
MDQEVTSMVALAAAPSEYYLSQAFIEGRNVVAAKIPCASGPAALIAQAFKDIKAIMSRGGKLGNLSFSDDGNGWYSVVVLDGVLQGVTGIFRKGDTSFYLDRPNGRWVKFDLPV